MEVSPVISAPSSSTRTRCVACNPQALRRDEIVQSLSLQLDQHRAELSRMTWLARTESSRALLPCDYCRAGTESFVPDVTAATDWFAARAG